MICPPDCLACKVERCQPLPDYLIPVLARRVHELEQQCATLTKSVCEDRATVIRHYARIQELEAALRFYADPANHKLWKQAHSGHLLSEVLLDIGDRARKALEGKGE